MSNKESFERFLDYFKEIMNRNYDFLSEYCKNVDALCVELLDDVLFYMLCLEPKNKSKDVRDDMFSKYLMYPMLTSVIFPAAQSLYILVLQGAIPQVYYTLRSILEAAAVAIYADTSPYLKDKTWVEKIEDQSIRDFRFFRSLKNGKSPLRESLISAFGEKGEEYVNFLLETYEFLSAWLHPVAKIRAENKNKMIELTAGLFKTIVSVWGQYLIPPSYGIGIPAEYSRRDLEALRCLKNNINDTRLALAVMMYAWSLDKNVNKDCIKEILDKRVKEREC